MANLGVGGNLVLPGGQYGMGMFLGPGLDYFDQGGGAKNANLGAGAVGGQGLLSNFGNVLQQGQQGGFYAGGPRVANIYNPNDAGWNPQQHAMYDNASLGVLGAMYGSPDGRAQGTYQRFMDAQGHYDRTMAPFEPVATSAMGAQLGSTYRNNYGQTMGQTGSQYDLFNTFGQGQNSARQNAYLDPASRVSMARTVEQSAPYDRPNPLGWAGVQAQNFGQGPQSSGIANAMLQGQRNLSGGSDAVAQYLTGGARGLSNQYESDLLAGIDTEAQKTLANQLQDTQNTLAGSGLSRSGAGQMQLLSNQSQILEQANRDKIAALAQMREGNLGREFSALSQGGGVLESALGRESQMLGQAGGMLGQETAAEQARRGQMVGSGLESLFQSAEGSRAAERNMLLSSLGDTTQMYQGDMGRMLQGLTSSDQQAFQRQMGESQMRSAGLDDWMQMQGYRDQDRSNRLGEMLSMEDRMRADEADRLAAQQAWSMLPWNAYMQMVTGVQGGNMTPSTGRQSPWGALGGAAVGALGNVGASWLQGGGYPNAASPTPGYGTPLL